MDIAFKILAVILAGVAAFLFWTGNNDGAFISTVLGSVAFFLSIRFQVKSRMDERIAEKEEEKERDGATERLDDGETERLGDGETERRGDAETNSDEQRTKNKELRTTDKEQKV